MSSAAKWFAAALAGSICMAPTVAAAQPLAAGAQAVREPGAMTALQEMSRYLASLKSFAIESETTFEEVLTDGQKLQYEGTLEIAARPPSGLKINETSDRAAREYFYNGRELTILAPRIGFYATVPAPASIGEMLRTAVEQHGLEIPLADLFTFAADPAMIERIQSGFLVGTEEIDGDMCDHYAFRQQNVDWQIWIRQGDQPLPRKLVITTTSDEARPDYEARLSWKTDAALADGLFTYNAPPGAWRIPLMSLDPQGSGGK